MGSGQLIHFFYRFDDVDDSIDGFIDVAELMDEHKFPEIVADSYVMAFDKNGDGKLDPAGRNSFKLIDLLCRMTTHSLLAQIP